MTSFEDIQKRIWIVNITVSALKRVKAMTGIDLGNIANLTDGTLAEKIGSDPVLLSELLYAVVKPEADSRKVSQEDFCDAFSGDVIEKASFALFEGLADFFPRQQGDFLRKLLALAKEAQANAAREMAALLEGDAFRKAVSGQTSIPSQESQASAPTN